MHFNRVKQNSHEKESSPDQLIDNIMSLEPKHKDTIMGVAQQLEKRDRKAVKKAGIQSRNLSL